LSKDPFRHHPSVFSRLETLSRYWLAILSLALPFCAATALADVRINEIMASNGTTIADEDGDFEDWIELHNQGGAAVDLTGWGLSDSAGNPFKWIFPEGTHIAAGGYLLVWASGKDRAGSFQSELPHFMASEMGLRLWLKGDNVVLGGGWHADSVVEWTDASGHDHHAAALTEVARPQHLAGFLNGHDVVSFNGSTTFLNGAFSEGFNTSDLSIFSVGRRTATHGKWQQIITLGAPIGSSDAAGGVPHLGRRDNTGQFGYHNAWRVNEGVFVDASGDELDWFVAGLTIIGDSLGVHYNGRSSVGQRTWSVVPSNEFQVGLQTALFSNPTPWIGELAEIIVFNRGLNPEETKELEIYLRVKYLGPVFPHTNFSISAAGEEIFLTMPDGTRVDELPPTLVPRDISIGRSTAGGDAWFFFDQPTPLTSNDSTAYLGITPNPVFTTAPGMYDGFVELALHHDDPDVEIFVSRDGRDPVAAGELYTNPLTLLPRERKDSDLEHIPTNPPETQDTHRWQPSIAGGTEAHNIVTAVAVREGHLPSPPVSGTWFINSGIIASGDLDVVSLIVDPDDFFGREGGIYVPGKIYEELGFPGGWGRPAGNYWQRGAEWERPIHFEIHFSGDGQPSAASNLAVRIHGGASRSQPQKSLRIYDRDDSLGLPLFEDRPFTQREFILRNSGQDWYGGNGGATMLKDGVLQSMVRHMNFESQGYRPVIVFLNGEFWGIHNIRERLAPSLYANLYGLPDDNLDVLSQDAAVGGIDVRKGGRTTYQEILDFLSSNSLSVPANFEWFEEVVDVDSLIDYLVVQTFIANEDWPGNNMDFWRTRNPLSAVPEPGRDGRWRWSLFDLDYSASAPLMHRRSFEWLAIQTPDWQRPAWAIFLINKLWESPEFVERFAQAYSVHLATTFRPQWTGAVLGHYEARLEPYVTVHFRRWGSTTSVSQWKDNVGEIRSFLQQRPAFILGHLDEHFNLGGTYQAEFAVNDPARGRIRINGVHVTEIDQPMATTGLFFRNVPLLAMAEPGEGYQFVGWQLSGPGQNGSGMDDSTKPNIELVSTGDIALQAIFEPIPVGIPTIPIHSWNFEAESAFLTPSFSLVPGAVLTAAVEAGSDAEVVRHPNAAQGFEGAHLRVNNPLGATITLNLPTTGFESITLDFLTRRSGQGAGTQALSYTLNGSDWVEWDSYEILDAAPQPKSFDFTTVAGAKDNPDFALRIAFEQGLGGIAGNNRFDDVTLRGVSLPDSNVPPLVNDDALPDGVPVLRVGGATMPVDLDAIFSDPDGDALVFSAESSRPGISAVFVAGDTLTMIGLAAGESAITLFADDGVNPPTSAEFTLLVYPAAHALASGPFTFNEWDPDSPAMTFPANMIFLQSEQADPELETPLTRAYQIPEKDAASPADVAQPYNAGARTRIVGLNEDGIAFINTGRAIGRDLGAALVAIDTTGMDAVSVGFTTETRLVNNREYAIRLQYRVGDEGPFLDVTDALANPVEYERSPLAGDVAVFDPLPLPADALDEPYVLLQWKYHYISGSGSRPLMRLDDITIEGSTASAASGFAAWQTGNFSATELADPAVSGPMADPVGAGITNLMRYALGLGRNDAPWGLLPTFTEDNTSFRFPFDPGKTDITYRVTASTDLADWPYVVFDSSQPHTLTPESGHLEVPIKPSGPRRFYRLEVAR
jgi:hypothetical protein